MEQQFCPVCNQAVSSYPRYPRYLCKDCAARAVDIQGRKLEFFNASLSGGFVARYADTQEEYGSNVCYVDGLKCWADEARFGGIVIERVENE